MYLLDTNVISELKKIDAGRADANVTAWASRTSAANYWLSAINILESTKGLLLLERRDPVQATTYRRWLEDQVLVDFADRILPFDTRTAQICAELHVPDPKPERDAMLAATALAHGLIMVTRNVRDFEGTGVSLLNPWLPEGR